MGRIIENGNNNYLDEIINNKNALTKFVIEMNRRMHEKSKETSKSYKNHSFISFNDIKELHNKNIQMITNLSVREETINLQISTTHVKGEGLDFKNFEEFSKECSANSTPTLEVILIYKFMIFDDDKKDFESYEIENRLISRVSQLKQIEDEAPPFVSKAFLSNIISPTSKITIKHDNYVKARNFISMFDEWVEGIDESNGFGVKLLNWLKSISHHIRRFGKIAIICILGFFTAKAIDTSLVEINSLAKFIVAYMTIFFVMWNISDMTLGKLEESIDSYLPLSYLEINKGDKKLIKNYKQRNSKSIFISFLSIAGTIILGIMSSATYDLIKEFIK